MFDDYSRRGRREASPWTSPPALLLAGGSAAVVLSLARTEYRVVVRKAPAQESLLIGGLAIVQSRRRLPFSRWRPATADVIKLWVDFVMYTPEFDVTESQVCQNTDTCQLLRSPADVKWLRIWGIARIGTNVVAGYAEGNAIP